MTYENLYDMHRAEVLAALTAVDDRATIAQARHRAHEAAFATMGATAKAVRELPEVTLESVLFLLGERP